MLHQALAWLVGSIIYWFWSSHGISWQCIEYITRLILSWFPSILNTPRTQDLTDTLLPSPSSPTTWDAPYNIHHHPSCTPYTTDSTDIHTPHLVHVEFSSLPFVNKLLLLNRTWCVSRICHGWRARLWWHLQSFALTLGIFPAHIYLDDDLTNSQNCSSTGIEWKRHNTLCYF